MERPNLEQKVAELLASARSKPTKIFGISGGEKEKRETAGMNNGLDILVATPQRLISHVRAGLSLHCFPPPFVLFFFLFLLTNCSPIEKSPGHLSLEDLRFLVVDEADMQLDTDLAGNIRTIIAQHRVRIQCSLNWFFSFQLF
jgi:superfamily II DNA/RNA helicase